MFRVYGVTKEMAKAAAEKKFKNLPYKKRMEMSPAEAEQFIQEKAAEAFKKMKPVVIGRPLDAPEFAQQLIDLTKKTTECRSLEIRSCCLTSNCFFTRCIHAVEYLRIIL